MDATAGLPAAGGRRALRRGAVRSRFPGARGGRVHDRHVRLPGVDDRPLVRRPADRLHLSPHRQLRRQLRGDGVRTGVGPGGDHARGRQPRGRPQRRARLAGLAGRLRGPGDQRARHPLAGPAHPPGRRDARRPVPGLAVRGRGARADRGRAADGRPGPGQRRHPRVGHPSRQRRGPPHRGARHRHQGLDGARAGGSRGPRLAAPLLELGRPAAGGGPRRRVPRQRPRRPGRAAGDRHDRPRADRAQAGVGDLPRPPAAVPGGRAGNLQAAVRPPRRQPPGPRPAHRPRRDHLPEPRLRRPRPRRASARSRPTSRSAGRPTSGSPS